MNYTDFEIINFITRKVLAIYPAISQANNNNAKQVFNALNELDIANIIAKTESKFGCRLDPSIYASTHSFESFCDRVCSCINPMHRNMRIMILQNQIRANTK